MFAGCTINDEVSQEQSRLPLTFETSLLGSRSVTRAVGNQFDTDDELLCYVRHVSSTEVVQTKMVTIKNGNPTESLYWDDFSESTDDGSKDLRTDGHGLQSYYGYCYNGGSPTTDIVKATGVLGWTTAANQTAGGVMKANDLLWSEEQITVTYDHAKMTRKGLEVPYTHAMSKFTIILVAGAGFEAGDLENTTVTLKGMSKAGTFTAPTGTVTVDNPADSTDVVMYSDATDAATATTRTYEAVTVPLTELTEGKLLAVIDNADGNKYEIKVTRGILGTSDPVLDKNWSGGLDAGKTKSGYNYKLTVNLAKQAIDVVATLADWSDVSADVAGKIQFSADVIDSGVAAGIFTEDDAFSLWRTTDLEKFADEPTTTVKYTSGAFVYIPVLYWENASTNYYFRALAEMTSGNAIATVTNRNVNQGTDLLWGTTKKHIVTSSESTEVTYDKGAAINPRTGDVPIAFEHAMSKVVINLVSVSGDAAVTLEKATFELTGVSKSGIIDIASGSITPSTTIGKGFDGASSGATSIMIPQNITDDIKLTVTLKDKTKYSLLLNQCTCVVEGVDTPINKWESCKQYTYTISLAKEAVKFRVLVQNWDEKEGSGNATLDWD